ncbi:YwmB family TATA-box binding protein [Clostridium cylindrosporum]|uniref:TATA-box binding protein n=1 Tax=Clostridium cylindrosporum DSM 605 TaxID=1121307 RepID=A0A0J8D9P2_CLOCY|nr:YwmB family TATA-box binding protein [Clostridium cylindrosporum]KMT22775.1 hypothetical protein CLCY_5c00140 [Clostridium cylindrosporum DSM 605]
MKKIIISLILIFSLFNVISTRAYSRVDSLENLISHSSSKIIKKEVFSYGHFYSNVSNKDILTAFIQDNFKDKTFSLLESDSSIVGEYKSSINPITITVSTSKNSKTSKYISVFYSHNMTHENIINLRENIRKMILTFDKNAKVSSQIVGKINKNLSKDEIKSLISSMLSNSSVSFNKDYEDSSVSFSGFTNDLHESISVNGKNINLQASGKYSKTDKCTYIWVGSPIISTEY